jgi:filamentous hemagglutinin family protein
MLDYSLFKKLSLAFSLTLSCLLTGGVAQAQSVTSDGTLSTPTEVTENGNVSEITGGTVRGANLFHSFQDFSVGAGGTADFLNADSISRIFSRVTGGNLSNIDGLIRTNDASLFLLNPAGILFGEGARLDLGGGSFYGSTADSLLFEDGEFIATNTDNTPVLSINAPIGLNLRDNPAPITNRSIVQNDAGNFVGLEVSPGATLALIGGDINFNGGAVTAPGGIIQLGGLADAGTVNLNSNSSFGFPENTTLSNVTLDNLASVNVIGESGGSLFINAQNLDILNGTIIAAGIAEGTQNPDAQAGDIVLSINDNLKIAGTDFLTSISNQVGNFQVGELIQGLTTQGSSGNIVINANTVEGSGNYLIGSVTSGTGDAGDVTINARESVSLISDTEFGTGTGFFGFVGTAATGNGGDLIIDTPNLTLTDSSFILTTVGEGNTGNIRINATDSITVSGVAQLQATSFANGNAGNIIIDAPDAEITFTSPNTIISTSVISLGSSELTESLGTPANATGLGGDIIITGRNISVTDRASLITKTLGRANSAGRRSDAGNITINAAESLNISGGGELNSDTFGEGDAGDITINANNNFEIINGTISSSVEATGNGRGGQITLSANTLSLSKNAVIGAVTFPNDENIDAETVRAGDIEFNISESLRLSENSGIISSTSGKGDAGNITINAPEADIIFEDNVLEGNDSVDSSGSIFSSSLNGSGDAGDITVTAKSLTLRDAGFINSSAFGGTGNGGDININAAENIDVVNFNIASDASFSEEIAPTGNAGNIIIEANSLSLSNEAELDSNTFGRGNAGNIELNINNSLNIDGGGSVITTSVDGGATGNGGQVNIQTQNLSLTNGAAIVTQTFGAGKAGSINVNATDAVTISGVAPFPRIGSNGRAGGFSSGLTASTEEGATGAGGEITVTTSQVQLNNGGVINAKTRSDFAGGNIAVNADVLEINSGGQILTTAFSSGNSGNITLNVSDRVTLDGIDSSYQERVDALTAEFDAEQARFTIDPVSANSGVFANSEGSGAAGSIEFNVGNILQLSDDAVISARSASNSAGGNININAPEGVLVAFPSADNSQGNDIVADAQQGTGGNITIETQAVLGLEEGRASGNNGSNDIDASGATNGVVEINTPDTDALQGASELPTNPVEPDTTVAQACSADGLARSSTLTVNGKGGIPPQPVEPLNSDFVLAQPQASQSQPVQPIPTSIGNIYPARGVIVHPDGTFELVAYETGNKQRQAQRPTSCGTNQ